MQFLEIVQTKLLVAKSNHEHYLSAGWQCINFKTTHYINMSASIKSEILYII